MRHGRIIGRGDQRLLVPRVMQTTTALERMRGLLGRPQLQPDEALLIAPCWSIHTLGMHYAIDVVFLTGNLQIRRIVENLVPLRLAWSTGSAMVLELAAGAVSRLQLSPGLELAWCDTGDA